MTVSPPAFVSHIGVQIFVDFVHDELEVALEKEGFQRDLNRWDNLKRMTTAAPDSDATLAGLLSLLRNNSIAFACGNGWSPAAMTEEFRRQGLFSGDIQVIKLANANKPIHGWTLETA